MTTPAETVELLELALTAHLNHRSLERARSKMPCVPKKEVLKGVFEMVAVDARGRRPAATDRAYKEFP
jgi:hypothetical protein